MKSRFTPEDDALLKELKEKFKLSWKQIADFFPDRKSGTLQVRYCTKIRKQDRVDWTEDSVSIPVFTAMCSALGSLRSQSCHQLWLIRSRSSASEMLFRTSKPSGGSLSLTELVMARPQARVSERQRNWT